MLPQVPPRPERLPSVPVFDLICKRLVTVGGPSASTGDPKCSTDLESAPTSMDLENEPEFNGDSVGLRSFGVPSKKKTCI